MSFPSDARLRLNALVSQPGLLDRICEYVSDGETLVTFAKEHGVPFGYLVNWIRADASRSSRYQTALADRDEHTKERYLSELRRLGISDVRRLYSETGELLPPDQWPDDVAAAVQSVESVELFEGVGKNRTQIGYTKRVKFWDKTKAIELLGKNLGLFAERVDVGVSVKLVDLVRGSYEVKAVSPPAQSVNSSIDSAKGSHVTEAGPAGIRESGTCL